MTDSSHVAQVDVDLISKDTIDVIDQKEEMPIFYIGQIWTNADRSVFRQILGMSKGTPLKLRYTEIKPGEPMKEGYRGIRASLDEFLWWSLMHEAHPILDFFAE